MQIYKWKWHENRSLLDCSSAFLVALFNFSYQPYKPSDHNFELDSLQCLTKCVTKL